MFVNALSYSTFQHSLLLISQWIITEMLKQMHEPSHGIFVLNVQLDHSVYDRRWVKRPVGSLWVPSNQCSPSLQQTRPDPLWIMNPGRRHAPDHKSYLEAHLDVKFQEMALFRSNSTETPRCTALNLWPSLRKCCAKGDTEAHVSLLRAKVCYTQWKLTLLITFN